MKYQTTLQENISHFQEFTKPANEADILVIENKFSRKLPESVREFLLLVGNDYDYLWDGGGADRIANIDYQIHLAQKLLDEYKVKLDGDYYPFSTYNGDQFLFFYFDEGDDPQVFQFEAERCDRNKLERELELPCGVIMLASHFSDFIQTCVRAKLI